MIALLGGKKRASTKLLVVNKAHLQGAQQVFFTRFKKA